MLNHPLINKFKKFAKDSFIKACDIEFRSSKINQQPTFQKIQCYDVDDPVKKKKAIKFLYNLENENPEMQELSEAQRVFLLNYINKNLHDHLLGEFYLEEDKLKLFRKVQNGLEHKEKIQKRHIEFILLDMNKSFNRLGYERKQCFGENDL